MSKLPKYALAWLVVSSLVVCWDISFVLNRPESFTSPLWKPYRLYITVDKVYGDMESNWVVAQSLMNIVEVVLNFLAVLLHVMASKHAVLVALVSLVMTFWKTVAYFALEIVSGHANTIQNDAFRYWVLYIIPNGAWIVVPFILMIVLYVGIARSMGKVVKSKSKKE